MAQARRDAERDQAGLRAGLEAQIAAAEEARAGLQARAEQAEADTWQARFAARQAEARLAEAREAKAAAEQQARAAQEQAGRGAAGTGRGGDRRAVPGGRGRVLGRAGRAGRGRARPARMTPRLSCSVPAPTVTRRPGSPPGDNPKAQHAAAGTLGKAERRAASRLHSGSPNPVDPLAGVTVGRSGPQDGGSGQPRGLRLDCGSWSWNCASHDSPRRCSRDSPTYVAALRSIAARSSSDTSRRTLPGTPATSTPSGTCCPSASTVPAAMIE